MQAERLFDELRAHPSLRADVTAYNVALKWRLARRDAQGALQRHPLSTATQPRAATPPGRHATRAYTMLRTMPLPGALRLFRCMQRGRRGAPLPRVDTYNTLLGGLRKAGAHHPMLGPTPTQPLP